MQLSLYINQPCSVDWGLSPKQAIVFSYLVIAPKWASKEIINGKAFYFLSKKKLCEQLPIITDKPDTMYRVLKSLCDIGVIECVMSGHKTMIHITAKGAKWNKKTPKKLGKLSDLKAPNLGCLSDLTSDVYPTNLGESSDLLDIQLLDNQGLEKESVAKNATSVSFQAATQNPTGTSTGESMKISDIMAAQTDFTEFSEEELITHAAHHYSKGKPGPHSMTVLWKALHAKHGLGMVKQITIKEKGIFGHYLKAAGSDAERVMVSAVSQWYDFQSYCSEYSDNKISVGTKPSIGFLLKNVNLALDFQEHQKAPKNTKLHEPLPDVVEPNILTNDTKPSKKVSVSTDALNVFNDIENNND